MNKKRLSIIIPRYKEDEKMMFPLLSSISNQLSLNMNDVEVVIGNDGGGAGPLSDEFISQFDVEIRQVNLEENVGCGLARQAAVDACKGDYIYWCDADDIIYHPLALDMTLTEIEQTGADILATDFLEEVLMPDGSFQYVKHAGHIGCWMHGKIMRKAFLTENNIRFHPRFREHEDAYFLSLAFAKSQITRYMPEVTYIWKYNPGSITRRDNALYSYSSPSVYIDAITTAFQEIEKCAPDQMQQRVVQLIYYHYFMLHRVDWMQPDKDEYRKIAETALVEKLAPYWHYYDDASDEVRINEYNGERGRSFYGSIETETLDAWLTRIGHPPLKLNWLQGFYIRRKQL